ncbi:MAG: amidohydrolase family protein [Saprospiraceae bacterium]|nr:amidohydrolase family protein [Saprospiraceae bacterium]
MQRRKFTKEISTVLAGVSLVGAISEAEECQNIRNRVPKTDTHVHLFDLDYLTYSWLDRAPEINRSFDLKDFRDATRKANVTKILFMESGADAGQGVKEASKVQALAAKEKRIKGIIARLDLQKGKKATPELEQLIQLDLLRGVRCGFPKEAHLSNDFADGLALLREHNLTFDLLLSPDRMEGATKLAAKFPDNTFILDHIGNPDIKNNRIAEWKAGIKQLSAIPNINCKISGVITRVGKGWSLSDIKPYVAFVIKQFGMNRLVYGGDWPVVLRGGSYLSWARAFETLTDDLSPDAQQKIYHENANRIYNL